MNRTELADFWDDYIHAWVCGESEFQQWQSLQHPSLIGDLVTWQNSYRGSGKGALDLACFPDPYMGDLRGLISEPRLIVLGLNPGVGYSQLQGRDGLWSHRIRTSSYSRCVDRSPPADPCGWLEHHQKESPYWRKMLNFGSRWCGDDFTYQDLLNFELYPWHSSSLTAGLHCPGDIIARYVLAPISDFGCQHVFAFGKSWEHVSMNIGLKVIDRYGDGAKPFPGPDCPGWTVVLFASSVMSAMIVVSWQKGYAGPPGAERLSTLKLLLQQHV